MVWCTLLDSKIGRISQILQRKGGCGYVLGGSAEEKVDY